MLFFMILLSLAFVCPVITAVVALWAAGKYWFFVHRHGISVGQMHFATSQFGSISLLQLAWLFVSGVSVAVIPAGFRFATFILLVAIIVAVLLAVLNWHQLNRQTRAIDIAELLDGPSDERVIHALVGKRIVMLRSVVLLLMFITISVGLLIV